MTYREYLTQCDDEWERTIVLANLARKCPYYDTYGERHKKEIIKSLLDSDMTTIDGREFGELK